MKKDTNRRLTTASGIPYVENENSMTAGPVVPCCYRILSCTKKWRTLTANVSPNA